MMNARYKIDSRTKSLICEAQILTGVPIWFDSAPPLPAVGLSRELRFYRFNIRLPGENCNNQLGHLLDFGMEIIDLGRYVQMIIQKGVIMGLGMRVFIVKGAIIFRDKIGFGSGNST